MAKDDSLKKPKKIDVNRIMIFISSILIPFLWIDLYLVSKNTSKMMVVGIIAALILVWTGLLVTYIHRMKNEEKAHLDEQVEELLRTGKANYLMQKKLAEKIDNIGEKVAVPADEIITAQKAIAPAGTQPNLNTAIMKAYKQVIPPIELQKEFIRFVHQVNKSKFDTMTFAPIYDIINLYLHTHFYQGRR